MKSRIYTPEDLKKLATWVAGGPTVPDGNWFKDFGSFKFVGTGAYPKTILDGRMSPWGVQIY